MSLLELTYALAIAIFMAFLLGAATLELLRNTESRKDAFNKLFSSPIFAIGNIGMVVGGTVFFLGIAIPIFGEIEVGVSDWKIWQLAGVIAFAGWLVTWFD